MRSNSRFLFGTMTAGGLLGVVIAWSLTGKQPPPARPPIAPEYATAKQTTASHAGATEASVSALAPATSASTSVESAPSANHAGEPEDVEALERNRIFETLAWSIPTDAKPAEESCTAGSPQACLGLGERHLGSSQRPSDAVRSQGYFERAFSILVFKCNHREPDACATIARMHQLGRGIPKNTKAAATLLSHARELCRYKPGTVCSNFSK